MVNKLIRKHDFIKGGPAWFLEIRNHNGDVIGFKGSQYMEAGFIYAPYIPVTLEEFKPKLSISSRYATSRVNNDFYRTITLNG